MKDLLDKLEHLQPVATSIKPNYTANNNIKACIFDIYGTLLISSSGDIDLSDISNTYLIKAFNESGVEVINSLDMSASFFEEIIKAFDETIKKHHAASKSNGIPYPEVNIIDIWTEVLDYYQKKRFIKLTPSFDIHRMTSVFEVLSNRIYPMPYAREVLQEINNRGIPMGVISNAQFYTPVIMNYFLSDKIIDTEEIKYINPNLTVYSYKERKAKPDVSLFDKVKHNLAGMGIEPQQAVFIGNDMLKDVYTANKAGFKTILFAGDKRSLRMRHNKPEVAGLKADYVITDLRQILEII